MADFVRAVRTREQPCCLIEDAHISTSTVQLGMIAYESESTVRWNRETEQIEGNARAARLLRRDYRAPYVHPFAG
jgi:hypothetical protein